MYMHRTEIGVAGHTRFTRHSGCDMKHADHCRADPENTEPCHIILPLLRCRTCAVQALYSSQSRPQCKRGVFAGDADRTVLH